MLMWSHLAVYPLMGVGLSYGVDGDGAHHREHIRVVVPAHVVMHNVPCSLDKGRRKLLDVSIRRLGPPEHRVVGGGLLQGDVLEHLHRYTVNIYHWSTGCLP